LRDNQSSPQCKGRGGKGGCYFDKKKYSDLQIKVKLGHNEKGKDVGRIKFCMQRRTGDSEANNQVQTDYFFLGYNEERKGGNETWEHMHHNNVDLGL